MAETGTAVSMSGQDEESQEGRLVAYLRRIEGVQSGYFAVHILLSDLRPGNRKPHYIRIAARAFEPLIDNFDATLFQLANCDLVVICREVPVDEVDPTIYKVRALFSEDPLTFGEEGSLEDRFTTWYDLSQTSDYTAFQSLVMDLLAEEELYRKKRAESQATGTNRGLSGVSLDPDNMTAITQRLEGVQIADLIRQQSAIEVHVGGKGEVLFREHYVSMADLQKRIAPNVNLFGSTWLFQYLTETLDRRMLAVVARWNFAEIKDAISLNLNISTVLGREFQHFHRNVGPHASKVVVEMQIIDIFADVGAYYYARDTLRESGYRVLVDGLNPLSLQFLEPGLLDPDLVKINWSREFLGEVPYERMVEMRDVVRQTGRNKLVLARVDSMDAIKWGLTLGINRFQGHYIDTLVEAMIAKGII